MLQYLLVSIIQSILHKSLILAERVQLSFNKIFYDPFGSSFTSNTFDLLSDYISIFTKIALQNDFFVFHRYIRGSGVNVLSETKIVRLRAASHLCEQPSC